MAVYAHQTAVGVFDDDDLADEAVEGLRNAGFTSGQIYYSGHAESPFVSSKQRCSIFILRGFVCVSDR